MILVTGSAGLIGSAAARFFVKKGHDVIGIDNNFRKYMFGDDGDTTKTLEKLRMELKSKYVHYSYDIRDKLAIDSIFLEYGKNISGIVHAAACPSHDWASKEPITDFDVNARATLLLLEATRKYCPEAVFMFTSTNKVYGDTPNSLPLIELETRWELLEDHKWHYGIDETMSIDQSIHSVFGVSKLAADIATQEYGKYFGMKTGVFRGGCLTGVDHSSAELHGFLAYLVKCIVNKKPYTIISHKGKQVRDNINSFDVCTALNAFYENPRPGEVYNLGGTRFSNISMMEAITKIEELSGNKSITSYNPASRIGDHVWWISSMEKFQSHYLDWGLTYTIDQTLSEMVDVAKSQR